MSLALNTSVEQTHAFKFCAIKLSIKANTVVISYFETGKVCTINNNKNNNNNLKIKKVIL